MFTSTEAGRLMEWSVENRYSGVSSYERVLIPKPLWKLEIAYRGIPGWLSGLAPAFGPGCDPGVLGSNPTSSSLCGAAF